MSPNSRKDMQITSISSSNKGNIPVECSTHTTWSPRPSAGCRINYPLRTGSFTIHISTRPQWTPSPYPETLDSPQTPDQHHPLLAPLKLGVLAHLPPELRYDIYDFMASMGPTSSGHDITAILRALRASGESFMCWRYIAVPIIAHVCREMRLYILERYPRLHIDYALVLFRNTEWKFLPLEYPVDAPYWLGEGEGWYDPEIYPLRLRLDHHLHSARLVEDDKVDLCCGIAVYLGVE